MPKGDKPTPAVMPIEEVASKLRVTPEQVQRWMKKGELRGKDTGVKPYDFNKFKLDHQEEIKKAQAEAKTQQTAPTKKKPSKKGLFARFFPFLGGDKSESDGAPSGGGGLARENKKLKSELAQLRAQEPELQAEKKELEDKVRYLESNMSRSRQLEAENAELKRELAILGSGGDAGSSPDQEKLHNELENARRQLEASRQQLQEREHELQSAQSQVQELHQQLQSAPAGSSEADAQLQEELEQARLTLQETRERLQQTEAAQQAARQHEQTIAELQSRLEATTAELRQLQDQPAGQSEDSELVQQLLHVQQTNLERFQRLHKLYRQAQEQLAVASTAEEADEKMATLKRGFDALAAKHKALLVSREEGGANKELIDQLASARVTTTRLKQENARLKASLNESGAEVWKKKVQELEQKLSEAQTMDASREVVESELRSLRKSLQGREAQVQKIAGRLQENERALKKALEESSRLTELLIERENKLRDLSTEYENEYRDKIEDLDRRVSGLQWKLSLREERIASLESELNDLKRSSG